MANPNSLESMDFQAWEDEMEPYGGDMLVETTIESPTRVLACTNGITDGKIMGIAPEDMEALSLA